MSADEGESSPPPSTSTAPSFELTRLPDARLGVGVLLSRATRSATRPAEGIDVLP